MAARTGCSARQLLLRGLERVLVEQQSTRPRRRLSLDVPIVESRGKPFDRRCTIHVTGGINRPPLERSAGVRALYRKARALAAEMGVSLEESAAGGGSDGNFTAALGVATLDGLGAVGEGAHASDESILIDRIADRIALLSKLVAVL